jgi:predicted small lipoprotein YifL
MKKFFPFLIFVFFLITLISCGKKGPILPPLPKVIQEIEVFDISQKGERLFLEWENPTAFVDGSPLPEVSEVEIWLFEVEKEEAGNKKPAREDFEKVATLLVSLTQEDFSGFRIRTEDGSVRFAYPYKLTKKHFQLDSLIFSLRVKAKKRRKSEFSPLLTVQPLMLSLPPRAVKAAVFQDRIVVSWMPAERNLDQSSPANFKGYNVYRAEGNAPPRRLNSQLIKDNEYSDKDFLIGNVYSYIIRASATESSPFMESDDSEILEVRAEDAFPPAVPSGLVSIVAGDFVSLTWDENSDEDLAGYRVWRRLEGEDDFVLLTPQPIAENAFNDTTVEKNMRYHYAVTAQDGSGNESRKSKSVSEIIKEGFK